MVQSRVSVPLGHTVLHGVVELVPGEDGVDSEGPEGDRDPPPQGQQNNVLKQVIYN